jgi:hypothetical protein
MSTHEDTTPVIAAIRSTLLVALCVTLLLAGLQIGASRAAGQAASDDGQTTYLPSVFQAAPVEVSALTMRRTRNGYPHVLGELANLTNSPVYSVTLEVRVYDAEDRLVATSTGRPVFVATVPGQRNPFEIVPNITDNHAARIEVHVVNWSLSHSPPYAAVTVASAEPRVSSGYLYITGELRNETGYPLEDVRIAGWSLNQYYSLRSQVIAGSLAPGAAIPYEVSVFMYSTGPPGTPLPDFGVAAQGIVRP